MTKTFRLNWVKCPCKDKSCRTFIPTNIGTFYQGNGFTIQEARFLDRAITALIEVEPDAKPGGDNGRRE